MAYPYKSGPAGRVSKVAKTFKTVEVVAAAFIAWKAQGDKIVKADSAEHDIFDYAVNPPLKIKVPAMVSNRTIMLDALNGVGHKITDEALQQAEEAINYVRGQVTMSLLTSKRVSDFMKNLAAGIEPEEVSQSTLGLLAYIPSVFSNGKKRDDITESINQLAPTSQALGSAGQKIEIEFTMIENRFVQQLGCYSVFGKDANGNLVGFLSKHASLCISGKIQGKVKSAGPDKYRGGATVTFLNYVKPTV